MIERKRGIEGDRKINEEAGVNRGVRNIYDVLKILVGSNYLRF